MGDLLPSEYGHTALLGSTAGAVTGCTRVQEHGKPEEASASAAAGNAGQMIVTPQTGGAHGEFRGDTVGLAGPRMGHGVIMPTVNVGQRSALSHGAYTQHAGSKKRRSMKHKKGKHGRRMSRSTRKMRRHFRKGSKSVTRPGHKDFMTYKGSKMYNEKRLKKLIGRKTMRAPVFSFLGGRKFRKGSKSVTRKGHEDFMTYKGSKMYNEKRLKKLIGRKTVRAPIFPFVGGQASPVATSATELAVPVDTSKAAKLGTESSVVDQLDAGRHRLGGIQGVSGGSALTVPDTVPGVKREDLISSDAEHFGNMLYGGRKNRKHAKKSMKGGYCQYMSNVPVGFGYGLGNVSLSPNQSALASPAPMTPYNHCAK